MAFTAQRARPVLATLAAGGLAVGVLYSLKGQHRIDADTNEPRKVFGKGPAFVSLPLESSEQVNHNTKKLHFKLPNETDVSGLSLTCM